IVGWTSTPNVANGRGLRGSPNANQLPTNIIQMKGLSVLGSPAVIAAQRDPAMRRERLAQILQWAEEGAITPFVSHTFPLHAVKDAMLARWNGGITGGCVLNP
nr:zinc-binding dehydrogenase [Pseudomonas sp.]